MCGFREDKLAVQEPDHQETLTMLRHSIVSRVDYLESQGVSDLGKRLDDLTPGPASIGTRQPVDVLKHKGLGAQTPICCSRP